MNIKIEHTYVDLNLNDLTDILKKHFGCDYLIIDSVEMQPNLGYYNGNSIHLGVGGQLVLKCDLSRKSPI